MSNKVKYNLKNVHIALKKAPQSGSSIPTFEEPFKLTGAVSIELEPKGEATVFYADGIAYFKSNVNTGYEGDLEIALVTDEFREKVLKETKDQKGVLLEKTEGTPEEFALGFQIDGDEKNTKFWFYSCSTARPTTGSKTNEEKSDPQTEKLKIIASGEQIVEKDESYYVRSKTTIETDPTAYENWFKSVYIPTNEGSLPAVASEKNSPSAGKQEA